MTSIDGPSPEEVGHSIVLPDLDLDESIFGLASIADQLRVALHTNLRKVSELFAEWDGDRSGSITREEFRRGMHTLKLKATVDDMDSVFDSMDPDKSGTIIYSELYSLCHASFLSSPKLAPKPAPINVTIAEPVAVEESKPAVVVQRKKYEDPPLKPMIPVSLGGEAAATDALSAWELVGGDMSSRNWGSDVLALVCHPLPAPVDDPSRVPLLKQLYYAGFSLLVCQQPPETEEAATALLLAAMDYIAAHRVFRYSKICLVAHGVTASAGLIAARARPEVFEHRLRVVSASQPASSAAFSAVLAETTLPTLFTLTEGEPGSSSDQMLNLLKSTLPQDTPSDFGTALPPTASTAPPPTAASTASQHRSLEHTRSDIGTMPRAVMPDSEYAQTYGSAIFYGKYPTRLVDFLLHFAYYKAPRDAGAEY